MQPCSQLKWPLSGQVKKAVHSSILSMLYIFGHFVNISFTISIKSHSFKVTNKRTMFYTSKFICTVLGYRQQGWVTGGRQNIEPLFFLEWCDSSLMASYIINLQKVPSPPLPRQKSNLQKCWQSTGKEQLNHHQIWRLKCYLFLKGYRNSAARDKQSN